MEVLKNLFNINKTKKFIAVLNENLFSPCKINRLKWRSESLRKISSHSMKLYFYFEKFINKSKFRYFLFPTWKTITSETNLSPNGISSALKELEKFNLIKIYKCGNKTTRYSKSIYFLMEYIGELQFSNYLNLLVQIFKVPLNLKQM